MAVYFDLSEVGGVADLILSSPDQATDAGYEAGKRIGAEVKKRAQEAAPKDRPWLSKSGIRLRSWRSRGASHTDVFTVPDEQGRPVGFFVEYGTGSTPPNPFLSSQMTWAAEAYHEAVVAGIKPLGDA